MVVYYGLSLIAVWDSPRIEKISDAHTIKNSHWGVLNHFSVHKIWPLAVPKSMNKYISAWNYYSMDKRDPW